MSEPLDLRHLSDLDALYIALMALNSNDANAWDNSHVAKGRVNAATPYALVRAAIVKVSESLFKGDRERAAELRELCLDSSELPSEQLKNVGAGYRQFPSDFDLVEAIARQVGYVIGR